MDKTFAETQRPVGTSPHVLTSTFTEINLISAVSYLFSRPFHSLDPIITTNSFTHTHTVSPPQTPSRPSTAGKMRAGARSRPVSHHGPQTPYAQAVAVQPTRKVFNCIVDDSALVAGVKRSTRNGIRQWVKNGHIRLFVPLHGMRSPSIRDIALVS